MKERRVVITGAGGISPFLIIGLCLGIARGSILAAASCICAAVALLLAPTIVDTLFAAHA